ncbi:hypothetical protein [Maritimibacter sp. DP1N21-5]|uniref:hypothetical protein n=1 Tax=Maritimibacter sp. DP1N21-5 TaxID=2836867 RepID=UPI001C47001C|nr:hypothetical protein [Maritimibacter sp. DP1N21-5]MBV7410204.1 hypothetical protein [Maritimibacter sp. DP1N21-5]
MPELVKLYIRHVIIGFALAGVFVGALLWMNVANLWHLVSTSNIGWIAVAMLFFGHGIVFAGVQFAITIMRMGEDEGPTRGKPAPVATNIPVRVEATAHKRP